MEISHKLMDIESETIEEMFYEYLKNYAGDKNIDCAKPLVNRYFPNEIDNLHSVEELIEKIKAKNMPIEDSAVLLKCLFSIFLNNTQLGNFIDEYEFLMQNVRVEGNISVYQLYKEVAKFIESKIGSSNVKDLKNVFKDIIDSERTFDTINTFTQLSEILEDRDALNDNDLSPLEYILGKLDENNDVIISKRILNLFVKLSKIQYKCKICMCQTKFTPPFILSMNNFQINDTHVKPEKKTEEEMDELQTVINYLPENLGPEWKNLARALKIPESKIKTIIHENNREVEEQAYQMLIFWRNNCKDPTINCLLTALKGPMCHKRSLARDIESGKYLEFLKDDI